MKTKLKHFFFLAAFSLAATACGGSMAKPVSGLDVSVLPARLLSISPAPAGTNEVTPEPLQLSEAKTNNQTATTNN